jgi:hypothetical protein
MAVRTLSHLSSLLALRSEIIHSLDQLKAHPLTQGYVPVFEGLRDTWGVVFAEELALRDALSAAGARVFSAGIRLDDLASRISKAILTLTGDDKTHALYTAYFNKKSLAAFKRPVLGAQHTAMRGWIPELQKSDAPELKAFAGEVEAAVKAGDEALSARAEREAESTFFRAVGSRKKLFDKANAVRKQTYGEIAKMRHDHLGLPAGFAEPFFRHDSDRTHTTKAPTLESVAEEIAQLEAQTRAKRELYKKLEVEAEERAKKEAEKAEKLAAIAELQKIADEAARKIAEATARVAELSR